MKQKQPPRTRHSIALMGLSGVGKTTLARILSPQAWFHYSVDYRIWTHYLGDELNDYLKSLAKEHPVLDDLLHTDSIAIEHRVHFNNLRATSVFMGMLGDPKQFGSLEHDFRARMQKHATAEIAAMLDTPRFIDRAWDLYQYPHFIADLSGSLCEVVEPDDESDSVLSMLDEHTTLVYIRATDDHVAELIRRATADPKPIYYRPDFLDAELPSLLRSFNASHVAQIAPRDVGAYIYPRLIRHRIERYERIARAHAITLDMVEAATIHTEQDLLDCIAAKKRSQASMSV